VDAQHVIVTPPFVSTQSVDKWLAAQGLHRKAVARVSHYLSVPAIIAATDCIATVPAEFAETLAMQNNLQILPLPIPLPSTEVGVYWHSRSNGDAGLEWLIDILVREFGRPKPIQPSHSHPAQHLEPNLRTRPLTPSSDPSRPRFSSNAELLA
jgi:DNA-binding transcriptional LysR family regulator